MGHCFPLTCNMHACRTDHNNERWYLFDDASREVTAKQTFHLPADLSCELCTVQVRGCDLYSAKSLIVFNMQLTEKWGRMHVPVSVQCLYL